MNCLSEEIKGRLTMDEVARAYGYAPNRAGYLCCPFHREKTPSLKLYPGQGGWHCFGCGRGGSIVDFVMELFGLSFPQALVRLNTDFGLGLAGRPPKLGQTVPLRRRDAERERLLEPYRKAARRFRWCQWSAVHLSPSVSELLYGNMHPDWVCALQKREYAEYLCECFEEQLREGRNEHRRNAAGVLTGGFSAGPCV